MVLELIPRKRNNQMLFFAIMLTIFVILCGCDMRAGKYPAKIASEWVCEVPKISLIYSEHESKGTVEYETIEWQNEKISVDIMFGLGDYCVYPVDSVAYEDRLFSGTWKYEGKNLVLIIDEDFIFDNQYSKLVFSPVKAK